MVGKAEGQFLYEDQDRDPPVHVRELLEWTKAMRIIYKTQQGNQLNRSGFEKADVDEAAIALSSLDLEK